MNALRRSSCALLLLCLALSPSLHAGFADSQLILPVAGRVSGSGGSEFYTTVWISNPGTERVNVDMQFSPRDGAPIPAAVSLAPGETRAIENITETIFGATQRLGSMSFRASAPVLVSARIFSRAAGSSDGDSQGAAYNAVPLSYAIGRGAITDLQGVAQNADGRYNFYLIEAAGQPLQVRVSLIDAAGEPLGARDYFLSAGEFVSASVSEFAPPFPLSGARLRAEPVSGDGKLIVAGSMTTNGSQDPTGYDMTFAPAQIVTGVTSLNGLTGAITLNAGPNVSLTSDGSAITISASGVPGAPGTAGPPGRRRSRRSAGSAR
jgi:hypothetical protein